MSLEQSALHEAFCIYLLVIFFFVHFFCTQQHRMSLHKEAQIPCYFYFLLYVFLFFFPFHKEAVKEGQILESQLYSDF
jgi:hypothetical protein